MALGCVPAMPTMACTLRLFSVERLRIQTSVRSEQGNQSLCGHCGTGHQPVAAKLFHRCAGKQRLQCGSTAHNDRRTGKGVGEVVSGVGKSVQHQAAFAQPQKDLKPAVGVAFPAAEQGAEMQQRICRGSE